MQHSSIWSVREQCQHMACRLNALGSGLATEFMRLVILWRRRVKATETRAGDSNFGTVKQKRKPHSLSNGALRSLCGSKVVCRGKIHEP
jgi:hypothetical protein